MKRAPFKRNKKAVSVSIPSYLEVLIRFRGQEFVLKGAHALLWNMLDGKRDLTLLIEDLGPWLSPEEIQTIITDLKSQKLIALGKKRQL